MWLNESFLMLSELWGHRKLISFVMYLYNVLSLSCYVIVCCEVGASFRFLC